MAVAVVDDFIASSGVITKKLQKELGCNLMEVPHFKKVILSAGLGVVDKKDYQAVCEIMSAITGQKAVVTKARKSIAGFKIREGMPLGAMVTLRNQRMEKFLQKLVHVVMPRIRDFRGLSPKSIHHGCLSMGIRDNNVFLEVTENVRFGMNITIVSSTNNPEWALALFKAYGFPIQEKKGREE